MTNDFNTKHNKLKSDHEFDRKNMVELHEKFRADAESARKCIINDHGVEINKLTNGFNIKVAKTKDDHESWRSKTVVVHQSEIEKLNIYNQN
jgi:hypothetical protein